MPEQTEIEQRLDLLEECLRMQQQILDKLTLAVQSHQRIFQTLSKEPRPIGSNGGLN